MPVVLRAATALAGGLLAGLCSAAPVAELHYRAILFDFYKNDYFAASTRSMAYDTQGVLGERHSDAELLRGGMFLSYGLFDTAERTFQHLLDDAVSPSVRNRAWYHLARLAYQRNDPDTARSALARIDDNATARRRGQRDMLLGLIAMRRDDYARALDHFATEKENTGLDHYARYNMGIAALRAGDPDRGRAMLGTIGQLDTGQRDLLALRDRANVALGFHALRSEDTPAAGAAFDRVRMTGPYATRALLGAGWAATHNGEHRRALISWRTLMERDIAEPAVQEAYLAAPHGLLQLGGEQQAADAYRSGIDAYTGELERLAGAMDAVRSGGMVRQLRKAAMHSRDDEWPLRVMRDTPGGRYLAELLAGHDFQRAAGNFRDLHALRRHLVHWAQSMDSFERMLDTRRQRYAANVGRVERALDELDLASLRDRRGALEARIQRIEAEGDALALATAEERDRMSRMGDMEDSLARLPASERQELGQRRDILAGYQRWQIITGFKPRLWRARRALQALDDAIDELDSRRRALIRARTTAQERFEGFARRIDRARRRVATLLPRVNAIIDRQGTHLEALAENALARRQERLRGYLAQARFALAQLHDRARERGNGETGQ